MKEYKRTLTQCHHGPKCQRDNCTDGLRIVTTNLVTGNLLAVWEPLESRVLNYTYDGKDKKGRIQVRGKRRDGKGRDEKEGVRVRGKRDRGREVAYTIVIRRALSFS